jgi:hypothetical protein
MSGPYGAAHGWGLTVDSVVRVSVPRTRAIGPLPIAAAAVAATMLLLLATGFRFGIGDSLHYVRAVPDYAGVPQYARDGFRQGLQRIAVSVMFLSRIAADGDLHGWLVACRILTVFGCCTGLVRIFARLAAADAWGLPAGALLIGLGCLGSLGGLLSGAAVMGDGFTASQVAGALVVVSLAFALDGSLGVAVAVLGLAFDADAAVALWGVGGLGGVSVALAHDGAPVGRGWLAGGACALVLAAPALASWVPQFAAGGGLAGDYAGYYGAGYFGAGNAGQVDPDQLLAWMVPLENWVLFGSTVVLGLSAFSVLGSEARGACGAFLGLLVVFAVGCGLPLLTDSAWLAILRPMAADTILQLLAMVAAAAVVLRDLRGGGGVLRLALSVAIAACLVLHHDLLPLAALAMLTRAAAAHGELLGLERRIPAWNEIVLSRMALGVMVLASLAGVAMRAGASLH